ncbi:MAG: hypothetical protein JEZ04_16495 [Spirochaetales bacterium]|nr:hypothetical protein [Spirochaetales bacterium]
MKLDFFNPRCQETPRSDVLFGICDDEDGTRAYTTTDNNNSWVASVINEREIELTFTAVDKCVLHDGDMPGRGRCDGMLTSDKHLFLIELKNQSPPWLSDTQKQLESSINFLEEYHEAELRGYQIKKIFACNKKRPRMRVNSSYREMKTYYKKKYNFWFEFGAEIRVV